MSFVNYKPQRLCGLEELAADQLTLKPDGGVSFARLPDGESKQHARQLILDIFAPQKWGGPLNMLTMPGANWKFEHKLLTARENGWTRKARPSRTFFSGVENSRAVYYTATMQMPGVGTPNALIKPVRKEKFPFAEHAVKTKYASFFFANVDDFLAHEWLGQPYRDIQPGWDAAWLDYTGPLTVERLATIARFFEKYIRSVLIVTALKARWNKQAGEAILMAGGHSAWLTNNLPGEVLHDLEYFDTSPMAQFAVRKNRAYPA